ncbi:hypothetical protein DN402_31875 [Streptomyces sp. SW4]|nr:hypothetical protein DN402_31875 [Streptomyces sp. SW4]
MQSLADVGVTKYPFGLSVTRGGREERWQIMHQLADGERDSHEDRGVDGTPFTAPVPQPGDDADVWLYGAIGAAECTEINRVERWAARPKARRRQG